ncbi:MAG: hypothetical protein IJQ66_02380 [Clostridia bacterium]|nr:hypothetical protein [Clostridia bacterium]
MKITYHIDDDYIQSSETIEIEIDKYAFELPSKPNTNKYLLAIGLNIAKLRGHTSAEKNCIEIKDIKL